MSSSTPRRIGRRCFTVLVAALGAVTLSLSTTTTKALPAPASTAAVTSPVGTYTVTVTCTCGTFVHTLNIDTYDAATGTISGSNSNPLGSVTGTVTGSSISMTWEYQDGSGYIAHLTGTIATNRDMFGSGTDSFRQSWTWTATALTVGPGPDHWWKADGNANDAIGNLNGNLIDGTYVPGAPGDPSDGQAFSFDGPASSGLVQIPNSGSQISLSTTWSLSAWIDPGIQSGSLSSRTSSCSATGPAPQVWVFGQNQGPAIALAPGSDSNHFAVLGDFGTEGGQFACVLGGDIPINTWTQVAITWDGTMFSILIDGNRVASSQPPAPPAPDSCDWFIGGVSDSIPGCIYDDQFFTGSIDEVQLYNFDISTPSCSVATIPGTDEPALVAVMVDGVQTSTPSDDFYPTDFGFSSPPNHPAIDSYCYPYTATYGSFPPSISGVLDGYESTYLALLSGNPPAPPQGVESLTDQLAHAGAVLLPYSYQGAYFSSWPSTSAQPLFHVNYSGSSDPGNTSVNQQAGFLYGEVQSIHHYWPDSAIEIVADSGGGVPAEYYWNTAFQTEDDGVYHIFTLDAPINGLDHTFLESAVDDHLGPTVRDFYGLLWQNMDNNDQQELSTDSDSSFIPVGSIGDYAYALGDIGIAGSFGSNAELDSLTSQILMRCSGGIFDTCTPQIPPDYVSQCSGEPYGFTDASHEVVRACKPTVDYITSTADSDEQTAIGIALSPLSRRDSSNNIATASATSPDVRHVPGPGPETESSLFSAAVGQTITIRGSGLGTTRGEVLFTTGSSPGTLPGTISSWSDTSVSVNIPSGAVSGPIRLHLAAGDNVLAAGLALLSADNGVRSLSAAESPRRIGGHPEQVTVTARDSSGNPVPNVKVFLFDGATESVSTTNSSGAATFSIVGFGVQEFLAHSGDVASSPIILTWNDVPGPIFNSIEPLTPACLRTITGSVRGPLHVNTPTCLEHASIEGAVSVSPGSSLYVSNSTLSASLTATQPNGITICASTIAGQFVVQNGTGFVLLGDAGDDSRVGFGCASDSFAGPVSVTGSSAGVEVGGDHITGPLTISTDVGEGPDTENSTIEIEANSIAGPLRCVNDSPSPINDGKTNSVSGPESGQCGGL